MTEDGDESIVQVLHVDEEQDRSRSCIVASSELARKLWKDGAFGSSTRSTRFMPDFLREDKNKKRQKQKQHTSSSLNQQDAESDSIRSESLQLNLLEAFYLTKTKSIGLGVGSTKQTNDAILEEFRSRYKSSHLSFDERYASYEAFRNAGWIPKVGAQYGADYVLYEADPNTCHSRYTIVLENKQDPPPIRTVLSHMRVAEQTRKKLVLCDSDGACVKLKRWVLKHEQPLATNTESVAKTKQSSAKKNHSV